MGRHDLLTRLQTVQAARRVGYVRRITPGYVEATGPLSTVGDICEIETPGASPNDPPGITLGEVAAVNESHIAISLLDETARILPDARVVARASRSHAPVGDAFAGRAVDAFGQPIDGLAPPMPDEFAPPDGRVLAPMDRVDPNIILETGVRAIDGLLTLGRGQRVGVFAAGGVGKTTLMRQLATQIDCDHCIICLVGERGREVEAFWRALSARTDRARFTCVAATSDRSAALRVRAVHQALCLAEYWRDRGRDVVLVVDSVTRYAMALREVGLSSGAPPTLRAYTPNVFSTLPRLVERCGAAQSGGSISAVLTVLSETDEVDDPIVETMKALLDGHIILSRQLANQGHFPAIDILRSISRHSDELMTPQHAASARRAGSILSVYEESRLMVEAGIYKAGGNPRLDDAIKVRDSLVQFLKQKASDRVMLAETQRRLQVAVGGAGTHG